MKSKIITHKGDSHAKLEGNREMRTMREIYRNKEFTTIDQKISLDKTIEINVPIRELKERLGKDNADLFHIEKVYPFARGGKLYVDSPNFPEEIEICEKKRPIMRELGLRYIILKQGMSEEDARSQIE